MAQDTTSAIVVYQGDGSNTTFSVPFDKGYYGEVKVAFVRRGLADYTYNPNTYTVSGRLYAWAYGSAKIYTHTPNPAVGAPTYNNFDEDTGDTVTVIAGQTITVNNVVYSRAVQHDIFNQLLLTWTGDMLEVGDYICIVRDTERGQPYELPNNQKHLEAALDNLERQIQELKDALDNALLVDPSHTIDPHKMDPIDWIKSIVRSTDFSARELRYASGWLDYSLDDPNLAEEDKTWYHLLNTDNVKNIRERKETIDGVEHRWVEYLDTEGQWHTVSDSSWEGRIEDVERIAQEAKDIAEEAKGIAEDANDKSDQAVDYAQQAIDFVSSIYSERYVTTLAAGQTTLVFTEDIEEKQIDLYWNGQLITQTGNWTVSGNTITLLFGVEAGDTIVVFLNVIRQVVNPADLEAHNTNPNAHAGIISAHNTDANAHAGIISSHNTNLLAHANIVSTLNDRIDAVDARIDTADIDCGTLS